MSEEFKDSPVFKSGRPDGRFVNTEGFVRNYIKNLKPGLAFNPEFSRADFLSWRAKVKEKLLELMAFPRIEEPQPAPVKLWSKEKDGYTLEKWEACPEPGSVVPFLILVPDIIRSGGRLPAVLCFPGNVSSKELLAGEPELDTGEPGKRFFEYNQMARHYAKSGMIAVAVENPGTCELSSESREAVIQFKRIAFSTSLISAGRNYVGLSVFQKIRILEWVRTLDIVDPERIAVSGHSLGTEPAAVIGVLDDGIKALVFNDFLAFHRERFITSDFPNPQWHLVPGIWEWFDFPDILAAFASRPLMLTEGGVTADLQLVQKAYEISGGLDNLSVHYYEKYDSPEKRKHDLEKIPEGITSEEYFEYANVDAPNHYFKKDLAVPFLSRVL